MDPVFVRIRVRTRRSRTLWRRRGASSRHSLPCEWHDPPALGGVGCRGCGSTLEPPGCLHHGQALEMTRAVSSQKGRLRAAEPPFSPPSRVPIRPGGPRAPGVCEEVRSGPRPWDFSSCGAGRCRLLRLWRDSVPKAGPLGLRCPTDLCDFTPYWWLSLKPGMPPGTPRPSGTQMVVLPFWNAQSKKCSIRELLRA